MLKYFKRMSRPPDERLFRVVVAKNGAGLFFGKLCTAGMEGEFMGNPNLLAVRGSEYDPGTMVRRGLREGTSTRIMSPEFAKNIWEGGVKKRTLLALILTFLSSACFAGEYVLVMSKDDCVCQHMLNSYNKDLIEYGEIKHDQHEEFTAIKWEKKRGFLRLEEGRKIHSPLEIDNIVLTSQFDINNDGQLELVVKNENAWYKSIPSDTLSYFRGEASEYFKDQEFDGTKYKDAAGAVGRYAAGFDGLVYHLKELPKISFYVQGTGKAYGHYWIGPWFLRKSVSV